MAAVCAVSEDIKAGSNRMWPHLLADLNRRDQHVAGVNGDRDHHVSHVTHVRAVPDLEHIRGGLDVAHAEGHPAADLAAQQAHVHVDEPCALEVRHETLERALDRALTQPEAQTEQRVPPAK